MKKIILSMALFSALLSCKKSNSGSSSGYHFTATIDGANHAFNTSPLATKVGNAGYTLLGVDGFTTQAGETFAVSIDNTPSGKPIVAGTYTDTTSDFDVSFVYVVNSSTQYVGGTNETQMAVGAGVTVQNHVKIVITSIDGTSIKGTFSGDGFLNADVTGAKKTVTNGDFYAKFQ